MELQEDNHEYAMAIRDSLRISLTLREPARTHSAVLTFHSKYLLRARVSNTYPLEPLLRWQTQADDRSDRIGYLGGRAL